MRSGRRLEAGAEAVWRREAARSRVQADTGEVKDR